MKFACRYLSRPSESFYTGNESDYTFIPESSDDCLFCEGSDCELFGRCNHCIFSSECDMNGTCLKDNSNIKYNISEEDELPF